MKFEKKEWEHKKLDSTHNDPSSLWMNVKTWLDWNNSCTPTQLFHDGKLVNSPAGDAGTMNPFFINKVQLLRQNISSAQIYPLSKLRETLKTRPCTMEFQPVSPDELKKLISGLKNSFFCYQISYPI